ncbi:replication factor A protein [Trifolium repens]|nr:replication factor A protein [Trifolium repens]
MVFNESSCVDGKFDGIADLSPGKENASINVRVLRIWKVAAFLNPSQTGTMEMVLVDHKSAKIHATVRKVCSHTHDYEFLVDVIGLMTGISAEREYIRDGKLTKMVIVELTDHSGKCECALFGDYVDDLSKKMGKSSSALCCLIADTASLQNVANTTRIFINPEIPEVEDFKISIAVHGIDSDSTVPLIGQPAKPSFEEEFLRMHARKTISELVKLKEDGVFAVCAEVVRIVDGIDCSF